MSTFEIPESAHYLNKIPNSHFNFEHIEEMTTPYPMKLLIWNMMDFGHVNWVHRKCYHHCKILARTGRITLLEYGINQFFFLKLPFYFNTLMYHELKAPNHIRHISKTLFGGYNRVEMIMNEFTENGQIHTKIVHRFEMSLPFFLNPFKFLLSKYISHWTKILWEEDLPMVIRRHRVLEAGFKDHPLDTEIKAKEGFLATNKA